MLKIVYGKLTITRQDNDIRSITDFADGVHVKFIDNVEVILPMTVSPEIKAIINTMQRVDSDNITLDFNNRKQPLTIGG